MRGRTLPSANFNNYGRVAGSDSFIKNLMFASPTLKIDIEPGKIDVAVVLLNINVLEMLRRVWVITGSKDVSAFPRPYRPWLMSSRCSHWRCARILSDGTWRTSRTEEFSCVRTGDLTPSHMIDVVIAGNDSKMLEARVRVKACFRSGPGPGGSVATALSPSASSGEVARKLRQINAMRN